MLVAVLFATTGIFLAINFFVTHRKFFSLASKIPGPKWHIPLIGILPELIGADLHDLFKIGVKYTKECKSIIKVWFGPEIMLIIKSADHVQKVLNSRECLDKPKFFKFFGVEQGSLFGTYNAWKSHRKILTPAFNPQLLKNFVPVFDKNSRNLIKLLNKEKCGGDEFDIHPFMSILFLETILSAGLDLNIDIQSSGKRDEIVKYFEE